MYLNCTAVFFSESFKNLLTCWILERLIGMHFSFYLWYTPGGCGLSTWKMKRGGVEVNSLQKEHLWKGISYAWLTVSVWWGVTWNRMCKTMLLWCSIKVVSPFLAYLMSSQSWAKKVAFVRASCTTTHIRNITQPVQHVTLQRGCTKLKMNADV